MATMGRFGTPGSVRSFVRAAEMEIIYSDWVKSILFNDDDDEDEQEPFIKSPASDSNESYHSIRNLLFFRSC